MYGLNLRRAVVTPHPGEAARLLGINAAEIQADRVGAVQRLIDLCGTHVVLRGRTRSSVYLVEMSTCVPMVTLALATAGSGDVLAGVDRGHASGWV